MVARRFKPTGPGSRLRMEIVKAAVALTTSAVRHASWWIEWHARTAPHRGSRNLADVGFPPEAQPCESS
jgi:hypothetical protein